MSEDLVMLGESNPMLMLCVILTVGLYYNSLRARHYLTRPSLVQPKGSPWSRLLNYGNDMSFLEMTGFNRSAFRLLVECIHSPHGVEGNKKRGRPPIIDEQDQIGLYLLFLNSTCKLKHLCMIFGVVPNSASIYINKMMKQLPKKLKDHPDARVKFPNPDEMGTYAAMVQHREPLVADVIGFLDGFAVPIQCSDDQLDQNANYSGYHHDTMCNNVCLFAPDGKVKYACLNYPGSWHDSMVCQSLITVVLLHIGVYKICVDQGFPRGGELFDKFVGPLSTKGRRKLSPILRRSLLRRHNLYVSLRQSSEWGMRALQGTFARLKSRLTSNKKKRYNIIYGVILLHNLRTVHVGLNQIATVFNAEYENIINMEGYDRIARYFEN